MSNWENQSEAYKSSVSDGIRRFMRNSNRKNKIVKIFNDEKVRK